LFLLLHIMQAPIPMLNEQVKAVTAVTASPVAYTNQFMPKHMAPYENNQKYVIHNNIVHTLYPFPRAELDFIVKSNTSIQLPLGVLSREALLFGVEIVKEWAYKCQNPECGHEYMEKPQNEESEELQCKYCDSKDLKEPDPKGYTYIQQKYIKDAWNTNGQKINDILTELEQYSDICDDAYLYISTDYEFTPDGLIKNIIQSEKFTIDVGSAHKIRDAMGRIGRTLTNNYTFTCTRHRDKWFEVKPEKDGSQPKVVRCPTCNKQCIPAVLYVTQSGLYSDIQHMQVFGKHEVILSHGKYNKSRADGYPPAYAALDMLDTFIGSESYLAKFFRNDRPPKGIAFVGTRNIDQLQEQIQQSREQSQTDPNYMPIVATPIDQGTRKIVDYINFTGSLEDLQLIQQLKDMRILVAALYGVMPIYEGGDNQTTASDALSMAVSNKATLRNQRFLETFLDRLLEMEKMSEESVEGWRIKVTGTEITDEIRQIQKDMQEAQYVAVLDSIGYNHRRDDTGKFIIDTIPTKESTNTAPGNPNEPSYAPRDNTNSPTGTRERKENSDVGGQATGVPASGERTSYDK